MKERSGIRRPVVPLCVLKTATGMGILFVRRFTLHVHFVGLLDTAWSVGRRVEYCSLGVLISSGSVFVVVDFSCRLFGAAQCQTLDED